MELQQLNSVVCTRFNRVMLISLCAETIKPVLIRGGKNPIAVERALLAVEELSVKGRLLSSR